MYIALEKVVLISLHQKWLGIAVMGKYHSILLMLFNLAFLMRCKYYWLVIDILPIYCNKVCLWNHVKILKWKSWVSTCFFNSPCYKKLMSFSDRLSSVICLSICRLLTFSTSGPISTNLGKRHSWVKGIEVCANEGPCPLCSSKGIITKYWKYFDRI